MPSAMAGNSAVQSASPVEGSGNTDTVKQVLGVIDKKIRNMEKRKVRLDEAQAKQDKGERLNKDQLESLAKSQELVHNLDFARELQKNFVTLGQEIQKVVKKAARREQLQREMTEQRRLKTVLELQFLLDRLGDDSVRQDLKRPDASSGTPLLSEADLTSLDEFYKLVGPERDHEIRLTDQYEEASLHLWELLEGREKAVAGTTYKAVKAILDKVLLSGYFDRVQTHQNGVCEEDGEEEQEEEEEEEEEQAVVVEESEAGDQPVEHEETVREEYTETLEVEATEFVNRQFIPDSTYSSSDKDQVDEWTAEAQVVNSLQHQAPAQLVQEPPHTVNPIPSPSPAPTPDPIVRKQAVQDLMAQMQGTYNFMQDSMLEFDGHALDPAIVSAQPMKPAQTVDLQLTCAPVHTESRLPQPSPVPGPPEPTQATWSSPVPPPLYQPSLTEPLPQTDTVDPAQASMSLSSEQPPAPSLPSAYPSASKPPHSGGINVNAAPFQSMQAVFNLNAPVPPTNEGESLKQPSPFPSGYSQSFTSQPEHSAEQPDIPQEALQSVGEFQGSEQVSGSQALPQQGSGFGRNGQAFYNSSRAVPRGGPRNARGVINGYRGSSNGFRGGYDGYRPPFANTPNTGYAQTQFSTPRDYNTTYQREGYQPGYKRGASQGPRGVSRGNTQAMRS